MIGYGHKIILKLCQVKWDQQLQDVNLACIVSIFHDCMVANDFALLFVRDKSKFHDLT